MPEPTTTPVALRALREHTIRILCDHFAADHLEVVEFERRLDVANRATTPAELERLTVDLLAPQAAPSTSPALAAPSSAGTAVERPSLGGRTHQLIVGIMGGATRRGRWTPAHESTAIGVMGGILLDFREVQLPPGETVVHAYAFWGGVSIVVPPELDVTVNGVGIMGGFDHMGHQATNPAPDAPRLRIDGVAIMGGVDVQVKGATDSTAWDSVRSQVSTPHALHRHEAKRQLLERRRQLKEEARRIKDEYRGRR